MAWLVNAILTMVLLLNLFLLSVSRMKSLISGVALQGIMLSILPLLLVKEVDPLILITALVTDGIKGWTIPRMLDKALRDVRIKHEVEPLIGFIPSMLIGAAGTAAALMMAIHASGLHHPKSLLVIPASMSTILTGLLLLTTRFKALTQIIGYLILENGIYIFGMLLLAVVPFLVELGILLDLFVGIFVVCIILNHIHSAFASLDTRRLTSLKE